MLWFNIYFLQNTFNIISNTVAVNEKLFESLFKSALKHWIMHSKKLI